jgi:pre-mRNA-processing factor 40
VIPQRNLVWKEYTAEGGRKYWYNSETKVTTWEMPDDLKAALDAKQPAQRPAAPYVTAECSFFALFLTSRRQFVASSNFQDNHRSFHDNNQRSRDRDGDYQMQDRQSGYGAMAQPAVSSDPEYSTLEEAEAVFFKLLKRTGAQPDWTWEQAMRATIKDPQYRAIKDPKDRRTAFEKYVAESRAADKEREKERQAKLRNDFTNMLKTHPDIKYYTRWNSARPIIERETLFRAAKNEDERLALFNDYRSELYKEHLEQEAVNRKAALDQLTQLLASLDLEPYTRWSEAQGMIQSNEQFQADDTFKSLHKIDIVKAFEEHIKALERSFNDNRQQQKASKARRERKNRDQFMNLLRDLKDAGKINAGTKWTTIHPLIEDDPRYVAMLGQSGSTPLDLFWDMTEEEERLLRTKRNDVLDVLEVSFPRLNLSISVCSMIADQNAG